VRVGGIVAVHAGAEVELADVTLDGAPIGTPRELTVMMNKPAGYLTAARDARAKTIMDLLPEEIKKRAPGAVGRLDKDVTGLLILTTDGQLAHRLISPKRGVEKVYEARIEGNMGQEAVEAIARGIEFRDFTARPARAEPFAPGRVRLTLTEGKHHQVKRMCAQVGHPVIELSRISIGGVTLDPALGAGECRALDERELALLYAAAGMEDEI
jgi:16S rRNA pseudouridine516 synthase